MKRFFALLLMLTLAFSTAQAEGVRRVYRAGEREAFAEDAETFDLYVCPLLGADCMLLTCGGQTMLVDMGKANDYDLIREVLNAQGVERIDIAFNTHPHTDHLGSMIQLLEDYPVGRFMTAFDDDYTAEEVVQRSTLRAVRAAGVPVTRVEDGDTFALGNARMTVVRQTKYMYPEPNPNPFSAMLMVEYGDCRLLLCADVVQSAQLYIAQTHDLKADIMKWPHHGLNKVYRELLENVQPEYAFITHGYMNTTEAQEQMNRYGIPHDFATWGVIHLSTDGQYWLVDQQLNEMGERCVQMYR
ncbi:MAG: MBL fold metallo-hydrolase [Clostridia bacterium]|nr:MBL fold metallo-hydrolase [Clostridia bacterium]